MWHASACLLDELRGPVATERLGRAERRTLERACTALLAGVGGSVERLDPWWAGVHLRTPLTQAEQAGLPDGFLSCPARDIAGKHPDGFERSRLP